MGWPKQVSTENVDGKLCDFISRLSARFKLNKNLKGHFLNWDGYPFLQYLAHYGTW